MVRWLADRGISLAGAESLTVRGRRTGAPHRVPVNPLASTAGGGWEVGRLLPGALTVDADAETLRRHSALLPVFEIQAVTGAD